LDIKDETGKRRLDNPEDFVRVEVVAALDRDIRVIPILVDGVPMPRSTELPHNLKPRARRNALQVNHHTFNPDAYRLIEHLELALKATEESKILKAKAKKEAPEHTQRQAEIERLLKAADLAIDLKDWKLAQEKISDVFRLDANHLDARSKLDIVQRKIAELEQEKEIVAKAAREKEGREQKEREEKIHLENEAREKAEAGELARRTLEQQAKEEREKGERKEKRKVRVQDRIFIALIIFLSTTALFSIIWNYREISSVLTYLFVREEETTPMSLLSVTPTESNRVSLTSTPTSISYAISPEWKLFTTAEIEIWLPPEFSKANIQEEISDTVALYEKYGYDDLAKTFSENPAEYILWGKDSQPTFPGPTALKRGHLAHL
jgi:hypothetical protein